ncbi:hypothetical protein VPNG_04156 [Cytospora leucostoma]|uniref:Uncharacterized protein n=1 Tax=Cytospora leucostoma TaxID=1230097 RepID=A0A423XD56_9PEZI|nr:hypothetical protein VPNG_04156 [Cytospora leucostoma]
MDSAIDKANPFRKEIPRKATRVVILFPSKLLPLIKRAKRTMSSASLIGKADADTSIDADSDADSNAYVDIGVSQMQMRHKNRSP